MFSEYYVSLCIKVDKVFHIKTNYKVNVCLTSILVKIIVTIIILLNVSFKILDIYVFLTYLNPPNIKGIRF